MVKGFKVLETRYQESMKALAFVEKELSTVNAVRDTLLAEIEVLKRVIHERDTVR